MKIENYYMFDSKLSSSTVQAHAINLSGKEDNSGSFDQNRLILGVYSGITFPVIFKQEYGKKLADVLDTGWPSLYLISDRMKAVLDESGLTGWETYEVKVLDKKKREIQGYHGLSIKGRCGKVDFGKSEIFEKRLVPNAPLGKYYRGLYVGLDEWDGSDFFIPGKYYGIIVTNRAAKILKDNKFTNVRLENLAEIETPVLVTEVMGTKEF